MPIASSTNVTKDILLSQSYANIWNLLNDKDNVPDPVNKVDRTIVYRRFPDVKGIDFQGYPFFTINPATADFENYNVDGLSADVGWTIMIEVFCSDRTPNNNGRGAEWCDELSERILLTLNDGTNRTTLRNYGMANVVPDVSNMAVEDIHQERVFVRTITLRFDKRLTIG